MRSPWLPSTHPTPWKKQSLSGCPVGHGSSGAPWCPTIFPASLEGPLEGRTAGNQAETAGSPSEGPGSVELVGPPRSERGSTVILQAACHQESRGRGVPTPCSGKATPAPSPIQGPRGLPVDWPPPDFLHPRKLQLTACRNP